MRERKSKDLRLVEQAYRGEGIAMLLDHPDVKAFFEEHDSKWVEELITCHPEDDITRRACAAKLQSMREFKRALEGIVGTGDRARRKLETVEK